MIEYRMMAESDIEEMISLGQQMHEESAFKPLHYSREKCRALGLRYLSRPDTHFSMCAEEDGKIVGMIMGHLMPYYFGDDFMATDHLWFVSQEKRGSTVGVRLLKAFRKWAVNCGAHEICIGVSTGVETGRTHELLTRIGFSHVGGTYKEMVQ